MLEHPFYFILHASEAQILKSTSAANAAQIDNLAVPGGAQTFLKTKMNYGG